MAQETNQSHQGPMLCSTGCGFYSNPRNNGMCSVCYKDFLQRQNSSGRVSPPGASSTDTSVGESLLAQCSDSAPATSPAAMSPAHTQSAHCSGPTSASGTSEEDTTSGAAGSLTAVDLSTSGSAVLVDSPVQSDDKPKAKKNRCFTCRKKVGLTGFDCRCGNVFCCLHRYSDVHSCTFNYKADAAEKIRKENPVIVGEKIQKI